MAVSNARLTRQDIEVLENNPSQAVLTRQDVEVLENNPSQAVLTRQDVEVLGSNPSQAALTQMSVEVLMQTGNWARLSGQYIELLTNAPFDRSIESTLVLTQTVDFEYVPNATELDAENDLDLNQVLELNKTLILTANNTLTLTNQSIAQVPILLDVDNTLVLSQDATFAHVTTIYSLLGIFHTLTTSGNTFNRTLPQTLTFTQVALCDKVLNGLSTLVLTQTLDYTKSKFAFNELNLVQTPSRIVTYNRTPNSTLNLLQNVSLLNALGRQASNILVLSQAATKQKIYSRSAENTLILSQELVRSKFLRSESSLLGLGHAVSVTKIITKSATNTLTLFHDVVRQATLNYSLSNTITFLHEHIRQVNIGPITTIIVPDVIVVNANLYKVELQGFNSAIRLPSPEFGDSDGLIGTVTVNRFKNGGKRVYRKTTNRRKLTYTFVLDGIKAKELKSFIAINNSIPFKLINFKGEIWQVVFDNNPFDYTEDSYREGDLGNKVTITLTFEGVRLN